MRGTRRLANCLLRLVLFLYIMRCPQALHRIGSRGLISFSEPQSAKFYSDRLKEIASQTRNALTSTHIEHLRFWRWSVFHGLLIIAGMRLLSVWLTHGKAGGEERRSGEQETIVDSDQTCTRQRANSGLSVDVTPSLSVIAHRYSHLLLCVPVHEATPFFGKHALHKLAHLEHIALRKHTYSVKWGTVFQLCESTAMPAWRSQSHSHLFA